MGQTQSVKWRWVNDWAGAMDPLASLREPLLEEVATALLEL